MSSGWPAIEARCAEFGDRFDEWQRNLGQVVLGKRADGIYAATVGGITLSIPRQVAKTFIVGRFIFGLSVEYPRFRSVWTAHRTRTSTNTFRAMEAFAKRPTVAPYVADVRRVNGEQEIQFTNGSLIMFGAREQGFGRGFDEIDAEVFDEAQILTAKALEDMVAATNQSRHPHGALLFYMGTPPRPVDPSDAFKERRKEALDLIPEGTGFGQVVASGDAVYIECSADADAHPDDVEQWRKANPSYPHRTPHRSMLRLRKNLPDVDSWMREALGVWDADATTDGPISPERFAQLVDGDSLATPDSLRLGLDAPLDCRSAWFSVAGRRPDNLRHISTRYSLSAGRLNEVAQIAAQLCTGHNVPLHLPPKSPALAWREDLERAGVKVVVVQQAAFVEAQQVIEQAVANGVLRHRGQPEMMASVRGLAARTAGDTSPWSRRSSTANVAPMFAAAAAIAGAATEIAAPPQAPRRIR